MARFVFRLPDVGEGITEAEIAAWHVEVGTLVTEDAPLVDIMTDKATVDITSPVTGVVAALHGTVGQLVAVGSPLVELDTAEQPDTTAEPKLTAESTRATQLKLAAEPTRATEPAPAAPTPATGPARAIESAKSSNHGAHTSAAPTPANAPPPLASPFIRRRAYELAIPLASVPGSAAHGRITEQDLDAYIASGAAPAASATAWEKRTGTKDTPLVGLRRKIAERLEIAARRIPHFGYVEEFDMTELEALRAKLNEKRREGQPKLTLLPFFMRAVTLLIPEFPHFNARYDDDAKVLRTHDGVHIGIATQSPSGLLVPVVRHCESLSLWECAREMARVTGAAREGRASRDELQGSTITLTSLGALGGISATPVINHPEVAIIAPNKLVDRVVVIDRTPAVRTMMNVSSAFDHRIIDGHDAARFIQAMRGLLERPACLFIAAP